MSFLDHQLGSSFADFQPVMKQESHIWSTLCGHLSSGYIYGTINKHYIPESQASFATRPLR